MDEGDVFRVKCHEELFPDADSLNLEEMQRKLDEQQTESRARWRLQYASMESWAIQ